MREPFQSSLSLCHITQLRYPESPLLERWCALHAEMRHLHQQAITHRCAQHRLSSAWSASEVLLPCCHCLSIFFFPH